MDMTYRWAPLLCVLAACNLRPNGSGTQGTGTETESTTETEGTTETGDGDACDGAAFSYGEVCFVPRPTDVRLNHPVGLDGAEGDEVVQVVDGEVSVFGWSEGGLALRGKADAPAIPTAGIGVVAGEFDDTPGVDIIVSETGAWAAVYHLSEDLTPTLAMTTDLGPAEPTPGVGQGFSSPVAVGPDEDGVWRVIGGFDDREEPFALTNLVALWEVTAEGIVSERLEVPSEFCHPLGCQAGDFNGDGRRDAVCAFRDECSEPAAEENIAHVVILANADGTVDLSEYRADGPSVFGVGDLNGDGRDDLVSANSYRLADPAGALGPAVADMSFPTPPEFGWTLIALGDLDRDGSNELLLGENGTGLIFEDLVGEPESPEEVGLANSLFSPIGFPAMDLNGDGVPELPVRDGIVLVSGVVNP